jgi:sulfate adenylyltransferase
LVRYHTYEVLKKEVTDPAIRWAYLPYSMHMAGPREAIQHMIIRKNYGEGFRVTRVCGCVSRLICNGAVGVSAGGQSLRVL